MATNTTAPGVGPMPEASAQVPPIDWAAFLAAEHLQQPSPTNFNPNGFLNNLNPNPDPINMNFFGFNADPSFEDSSYITSLPQPRYPSGTALPPLDCQTPTAHPPLQHTAHTGQDLISPTQGHQSLASFDPSPQSAMATATATATAVHTPPRHGSATRPKGKRPFSGSTAADSAAQQPPRKTRKLYNAADHLNPTADQLELLQTRLRQWSRDSHFPSDRELKAVATICELPLLKVAMWYGANLQVENDPSAPVGLQVPEQAGTTDRGHEAMIRKYLGEAFQKQCSVGNGQGRYRCTWHGCTYSTDKRYEWERHEESKQPQHFWICVECRSDTSKAPFITHRSDKIFPHLKSMHKTLPDGQKNNVRERSKVDFDAPFINPCHFVLPTNRQPCGHRFKSWKERNDHWIAHYDAEANGSDHGLPSPPAGDDDGDHDGFNGRATDDDAPSNHGSSSGLPGSGSHQRGSSNAWTQPGPSGNTRGVNHRFSASSGDAMPIADSEQEPAVTKAPVLSTTSQIVLLDVYEHKLVRKDSTERYLALKYDSQQVPLSQQGETVKVGIAQGTMPPETEAISTVMRSAIELTREMGFQYLWTELNEQSSLPISTSISHFQTAVLIIVMGFKSTAQQQIWHFTCDYKRLKRVEEWVHNRHWFRHDTPLGQGAYGFVDRVTLTKSTSHQPLGDKPLVFARKIILRDRTNRNQRARYVQEIEIMQKLNHPHIAKFEAAYYDRTAFNILMSPVAECDMRHFLSHPGEHEEQRQHLRRWFMSLAEALAYMHNLNCRHKDIKPANILISNNNVLLTDFGTAMEWNEIDLSTTAGDAFMTPKYCAPEVAAKERRGRRSDIFSLGCVFVEMLTVWFHHSLEQFHEEIQLTDVSTGRKGPYHERTIQLQEWLSRLEQESTTPYELKRVLVTKDMIQHKPQDRPLARRVTQRLCTEKDCSGLKPEATCHCCPQNPQDASSDVLDVVQPARAVKPGLYITPRSILSFTISRAPNGRPCVFLEEHIISKLRFEPEGDACTILPKALNNRNVDYTHRRIQDGKYSINIHRNPSTIIINATHKSYRRSKKMIRQAAFTLPPHLRRALVPHLTTFNSVSSRSTSGGPATQAMERHLKTEYTIALERGKGDAGTAGKDGSLVTPSIMQAPAFNHGQGSSLRPSRTVGGGGGDGAAQRGPGAATQALQRRLKTEYAMALDRDRSMAGSSSKDGNGHGDVGMM